MKLFVLVFLGRSDSVRTGAKVVLEPCKSNLVYLSIVVCAQLIDLVALVVVDTAQFITYSEGNGEKVFSQAIRGPPVDAGNGATYP